MNILLHKLPNVVSIDNIDYVIHTDFRIGIQFEILMANHKILDSDKIMQALKMFYLVIPRNIGSAIDQILWFYNCGLQTNETNNKSSSSQAPVFSYEQDQYMIYTAFLSYYHIDLNSIEYLHWWKFKQLLNELPNEAKLKKVMMYRMIKINSNMSKEQKQFYAEMKSIYKLADGRTEKQKANTFASILAGGMYLKDEIPVVDE